MSSIAKKTLIADLEKEMRQSYLDYAMSVILGRALPDVRDGLKPVHRRILYAMLKLGNAWDKPYKKSARVTGDVIGKYHPHGDSAIYDAIVRIAQDFSMRYPLVDGQGNFGSVDGDKPAAMRYTEVRLSRIAHELLADIDKETVDFVPNYDETELQPVVLPTRLPNLLLNGSEGIAVGMSTKVPPHNLTETINACLALIENDDLSIGQLIQCMPGPDFPTGGIINGREGIWQAYSTGSGSIRLRGRTEVEDIENSKRQALIFTELPYQVNKSDLIEKIAGLVKSGSLEGISTIRDETDKSGMRVVIELRTNANAELIENVLYSKTNLEISYGINFVVIENNKPRLFSLKEILSAFIQHRREVVTRKLEFELKKALARAHTLEGLAVALSNIDRIIELIRAAPDRKKAKADLMQTGWDPTVVRQLLKESEAENNNSPESMNDDNRHSDGYWLSESQTDEILKMPLQNLAGLEQEKVFREFREVLAEIAAARRILGSQELLMKEISDELIELRDQYGRKDERRTEIIESEMNITNEDLIEREDVIVTISHEGYAKQQPVSEYRSQNRGGKGKTATTHKTDDFVSQMFSANTHDKLLCFTNLGKVYWTKVYCLERAGRTARGKPLINVIPSLAKDEKVTAVLRIQDEAGTFLFMATRQGLVKKCSVEKFSRPRSNGIRAIGLREGDELVDVGFTSGDADIILISNIGRLVRFSESKVRASGRTSMGVKGIRLDENQYVISMIRVEPEDEDGVALLVSSDGYGKRTDVSQFPRKGRATAGVYVLPANKRQTTEMIDGHLASDEEQVMLITNGGTLIRTEVDGISKFSRIAAGVRLINLEEGQQLVSVAIVSENGDEADDSQSEDSQSDEETDQ